jgi:hypothetical protein
MEHPTEEEIKNVEEEQNETTNYEEVLEGIMNDYYNKINTLIHITIGNNADTIELTEEQVKKLKSGMVGILGTYDFFPEEILDEMKKYIFEITDIFN